jgi:hypothetical protein
MSRGVGGILRNRTLIGLIELINADNVISHRFTSLWLADKCKIIYHRGTENTE